MSKAKLYSVCFNCGQPTNDCPFCNAKCRNEYAEKQRQLIADSERKIQLPKIPSLKRKRKPKAALEPRTCPCGNTFTPIRRTNIYCCIKHARNYRLANKCEEYRRAHPKYCEHCGKLLQKRKQKWCSRLCWRRAYMAQIRSDPIKLAAYQKMQHDYYISRTSKRIFKGGNMNEPIQGASGS